MDEVLVRRDGAIGRLTLNRPKAIGALTTGMCQMMLRTLLDWRSDPDVKAVLIDHAGERGFCAGGDIRALAASAAGDGTAALEFFRVEYQLDALIGAYEKPVAAVMDGLVMGGGVGISLPARYRIATERTVLAMPETGIGLFPDVGAGWFLPKLHGKTGLWLSLTGARLKAADCELLGLATDLVPSAALDAFKEAFAADPDNVERLLAQMEADGGPAPLGAQREHIDRLFAGDSVEAILAALEADGGEWAAEQLAILKTKSPLSMKVTFRQMQTHAASLPDDLAVEFRIASRLGLGDEFREGVRAVIVDKDNAPQWPSGSLEAVTGAMVEAIFAPLPAAQEWKPLTLEPMS